MAPSQSTHCASLHVLFLPRSSILPVRTRAWPTVTEGLTEGRLRRFGRGCRCRCSAAQHRQRHCQFSKEGWADLHCLLLVLVCAERATDVKDYRFVSSSKRENNAIKQNVSSSCLMAEHGIQGDFSAGDDLLRIRECRFMGMRKREIRRLALMASGTLE
jgi:hypothetical protein